MIRTLLFVVLALPALFTYSQTGYGYLDINNIRCRVYSNGALFQDKELSTAAFEVPQGENLHTLYAANLWIGGLDENGQIHLAAEKYGADGYDWFPGPLTVTDASTDEQTMLAYDRVWIGNAADVETHIAYFEAVQNNTVEEEFPNGYVLPTWMFDWPAHGNTAADQAFFLAPFFDYNSDLVYDPTAGDYPLFCGDQCVYFIFNDRGGPHTESGGEPIGLEIHGMLYGFNAPDDPALHNTVFLKYRVIHRGSQVLNDTYIGSWADLDIGTATDDYVGTEVARSSVFGYNGDNLDEASSGSFGYGEDLPMQAVQILAGPLADADAADNPLPDDLYSAETSSYGDFALGYGDGMTDNERLGLSYSVYYNNSGNQVNGDPSTPVHFYYYLQGMNGLGAPFDSRYAYYGYSDPLHLATGSDDQLPFDEVIAGNPPGDRRIVGSTGPFTLVPGSQHFVDIAYVFARESDESEYSVSQTLNSRLKETKLYFNENLIACGLNDIINGVGTIEGTEQISMYPNPADEVVHISFEQGFGRSSTIQIMDLTGNVVAQSRAVHPRGADMPVASLSPGIYLVQVTSGNQIFSARLVVRH